MIQLTGTLLLAAGALHGLWLSFMAWFRKYPDQPGRAMANRFLGIYFGAFSFFLVNASLFFAGWLQKVPFLLGLPMPFLYLIGPSLWFYVRFSLQPGRIQLHPKDYWHFLPALLCFLIASPYYFSDPSAKAAYLAQLTPGEVELPASRAFYFGGHLLQTMAYCLVLRPEVRKASKLFSVVKAKWIRDLFTLLTGLLLIYLGTFVSFLLFKQAQAEIRFGFEVTLALFIHLNFFLILRESAVFKEKPRDIAVYADEAPASHQLSLLKRQILYLMETEKPYLDPDFTLSDLAAQLDSNTYYVSRAINRELG
ncbi:MAG: hypothetical protein R3350_01280, partial [Saprospiraceae bacterium]|nr:hypothetical protein [Saprospiraceae bacterium]